MGTLKIRLFGEFYLTLDGEPVEFRSQRLQSLLAYLLLHRDAPQSRDRIAFALWPAATEPQARRNLRQLLYRLRKTLPDADHFLHVTRQTLQWRPDAPFTLDVAEFVHALDGAPTRTQLQKAIELYSGDLLPACYEEWALREREDLRDRFLAALEELVDLLEDEGAYHEAIAYTRRLLHHEPLRERTYRRLMQLYIASGDRAGALRVYHECARVMTEELDVEPGEATQQLYETLVQATPDETPHNLPPQPTPFVGRASEVAELATRLNDPTCRLLTITGPGGIGKTRLALQIAREQLDSFTDGVFFIALGAVETPEHIIPAIAEALDVTFHGEADAQQRLYHYLQNRRMLLVLDEFEHLLPANGADVLVAILQQAPTVTLLVTSRQRLDLRWEWCFRIEGLRVPPVGADRPVLEDHSAVHLFRQVARRRDRAFALTEETWPAVARLCRLVEGMPLAIELAASLVPERACTQILATIEHDLDAGNSTNRQNSTATLDVLRTSMRDVPARHRSLRAVFASSWQRLSPREQRVFRRLAVFRGSFSGEAARAVAGASDEVLASLVDKSLVQEMQPGYYVLHALLRQYAEEKLAAVPDEAAATRERHSIYYGDLLHRMTAPLLGDCTTEAVAVIGREIGNVRLAWQHAAATGDAETIDRGLTALSRYYHIRASFQEAVETLERTAASLRTQRATSPPDTRHIRTTLGRVLAEQARFLRSCTHYKQAVATAQEAITIAQECHDAVLEARGHLQHGWTLLQQDDHQAAEAPLQRALTLAEDAENVRLEADSLRKLGGVYLARGEYTRARRTYEAALRLYDDLGDRRGVGATLNNLGVAVAHQGKLDAAGAYYRRVADLWHDIGDRRREGLTLLNLGQCYLRLGDFATAEPYLERALHRCREVGGRWGEGLVMAALGELYYRHGEHETAREYSRRALHLGEQLDDHLLLWEATLALGNTEMALGSSEAATDAFRRALAQKREADQPHLALIPLAGLARIALEGGAIPRARELIDELLADLTPEMASRLQDPFPVYLTCYRVLRRTADSRAAAVLHEAHALLQERAAAIDDEELRRSFLENVATNRAILEAGGSHSRAEKGGRAPSFGMRDA